MKIRYQSLHLFYFYTQNRARLILEVHRKRIEKYFTGIVNNNDCRLNSIYANSEHIHFLTSDRQADSSSKFINENRLSLALFSWQETASAFSVSKSDVDKVCKYIQNQPEHHKKVTFAEEYDDFIKHYQQTLKWRIR